MYRNYPDYELDWEEEPRPAETGAAHRIPRPAPDRLRRLERLTWLLDRAIPIGNFRFGLDPILGLMPGLGDALGAVLSLYVLYEGARLGAPGGILLRMAGNILVETVIGAVPFLGDVFDFVWQANVRNFRLIQQHHGPHWRPRSLRAVWIPLAIASALTLAVAVTLAWLVLDWAARALGYA